MKLIDLLVQELPKRGGWPECCHALVQGSNGAVYLAGGGMPLWKFYLAEDWELEEVTREQYEAALAASQRCVHEWIPSEGRTSSGVLCRKCGDYDGPGEDEKMKESNSQVWDGEGLPPVGCECEAKYRDATNAEWFFFRCVGVDCGVAFGWAGKEAVTLGKGSYEFRTIRSEADKKRAAVVTAFAKAGGDVNFEYGRKTIDGELSSPGWYKLYDKIAAGEIAGIRIE
ncbi:hypothetical protein ACI49Z_003426 [Cronobacter turicensis]